MRKVFTFLNQNFAMWFLKFEHWSLGFLPWVHLSAVMGWFIKGILGFRVRYPFHALQLSSHMIKLFINQLVC